MAIAEDNKNINHSLSLSMRQELRLDGVIDLLDFGEGLAEISTSLGTLIIEGSDMHIVSLDTAEHSLSLGGKIDSLYYTEKKAKKSHGLFSGGKNQK